MDPEHRTSRLPSGPHPFWASGRPFGREQNSGSQQGPGVTQGPGRREAVLSASCPSWAHPTRVGVSLVWEAGMGPVQLPEGRAGGAVPLGAAGQGVGMRAGVEQAGPRATELQS